MRNGLLALILIYAQFSWASTNFTSELSGEGTLTVKTAKWSYQFPKTQLFKQVIRVADVDFLEGEDGKLYVIGETKVSVNFPITMIALSVGGFFMFNEYPLLTAAMGGLIYLSVKRIYDQYNQDPVSLYRVDGIMSSNQTDNIAIRSWTVERTGNETDIILTLSGNGQQVSVLGMIARGGLDSLHTRNTCEDTLIQKAKIK